MCRCAAPIRWGKNGSGHARRSLSHFRMFEIFSLIKHQDGRIMPGHNASCQTPPTSLDFRARNATASSPCAPSMVLVSGRFAIPISRSNSQSEPCRKNSAPNPSSDGIEGHSGGPRPLPNPSGNHLISWLSSSARFSSYVVGNAPAAKVFPFQEGFPGVIPPSHVEDAPSLRKSHPSPPICPVPSPRRRKWASLKRRARAVISTLKTTVTSSPPPSATSLS